MTTTDIVAIDDTNLQSLAKAISLGITTVQQLDDWINNSDSDSESEIIDGCLCIVGSPWLADDGNAEIETTGDSAAEACDKYVAQGDWGDVSKTTWVSVTAWRRGVDSDGDIVDVGEESHDVTIEPTEPDCASGREHVWHDWRGPQGHGGGVFYSERCLCCGCEKATDTWAQNPANGQQGLHSVEYTAGEHSDAVLELAIERAKKHLDTDTEQRPDEFSFCWTDADGDIVGADDDDLAELGFDLLADEDATITGTLVSAENDE